MAWRHHILLIPLMAHGHLKPFLQLARQIKRRSRGRSLTLTILTTPRNVQLLREMAEESCDNDDDRSTVRLVELPFRCSDHGLPDEAENLSMIPLKDMIKLLRASTSLEAPLTRFIVDEIVAKEGSPPLCIVSDYFFGWAVKVANTFGSLPINYSTAGAYGTAAYVSIWRDLPHQAVGGSEEFSLPSPFPETHRFTLSHLSPIARVADGTDEWSRFMGPQMRMSMESAGWLCNTAEEIEPLGLSILRGYLKLPVWAVAVGDSDKAKAHADEDKILMRWLDLQDEESVLYISFGSQNSITLSQMMELATGLEESGKRFVWVIRPPYGFDLVEGEFRSDWLPNGFLHRVVETKKRGFLLHKMAPQTQILAHKSIGAFLSHCGWNSVLEALSQGVPIIGWPLAAEQAFNSKLLTDEFETAIEVARGLEAKLTKENVKMVISMALDRHGKGRSLKRNAAAMAARLRLATNEHVCGKKGSTLHAIDAFLEMLQLHQCPAQSNGLI